MLRLLLSWCRLRYEVYSLLSKEVGDTMGFNIASLIVIGIIQLDPLIYTIIYVIIEVKYAKQ